jgi:hypothetical protein
MVVCNTHRPHSTHCGAAPHAEPSSHRQGAGRSSNSTRPLRTQSELRGGDVLCRARATWAGLRTLRQTHPHLSRVSAHRLQYHCLRLGISDLTRRCQSKMATWSAAQAGGALRADAHFTRLPRQRPRCRPTPVSVAQRALRCDTPAAAQPSREQVHASTAPSRRSRAACVRARAAGASDLATGSPHTPGCVISLELHSVFLPRAR